MHTGPRGPLLFGWCTHYVPTTSHQPPASFCTVPAPPCTLRAWLHCHIWTCPSIHVSLCLEEFSPQTSPSGTNYPMVGVLSMCPPHHFSQIPTSGHPCRPARCKRLNSELGAQTALHLSVSKGVIQRKRESRSSATSSSNDNSRPGPMAQAVHTGMKYVLFS